jgi:hypothetical protein
LSRTYDVIVAATLLALLVVAIVTRATISNEIADSNVDRPSYVAFVIEFVATLGLSIGLAWCSRVGRVRIAFDVDNPGRWSLHCHNLYHMVIGMMAEFRYQGIIF